MKYWKTQSIKKVFIFFIVKVFQKQPFRGVLRKRSPENMQQVYTRAEV